MSEETNTEAAGTEAAASRRKWRFDNEARTLTMTEPNGSVSTYPLGNLPQASQDYISQLGLTLYLSRAEAPDAAFDKLIAGDLRQRGEAKPKPVNHWRQAMARAMQEHAKKQGTPLTDDEASEKAAGLDKQTYNGLKTDPGVIKHYNRLAGVTGGVAALLAA